MTDAALLASARVPQTWAELADEIGPAAALALSAAYGGVNIYVPRRMTRAHAIARLFDAAGAGFAAALALSELHGDTTLHVPRLSAFWRIAQASQALELLHAGASPEQAAAALGISTSTLRRTLDFARAISLTARSRRDSRRLRRRAAVHADMAAHARAIDQSAAGVAGGGRASLDPGPDEGHRHADDHHAENPYAGQRPVPARRRARRAG